MSALITTDDRPRRALAQTEDVIPILDTAKFEHMQRVANVMAATSMIPDALCMVKVSGEMVPLPQAQVVANCFLIVNQSVRWGMDPFAVAQCVSIVHGKLCYEGKLVSAVLDAKLGIKLHHYLTGAPGDSRRIYLSDVPFDDELIDRLSPGLRVIDRRLFDGSVAEWKTSGTNSPWSPKNFDRMLIYRGTRDWCRIYEPAIMLGVYTPDEMLDLSENARASRARDITSDRQSLSARLAAPPASEPAGKREGFDHSSAAPSVEARQQPATAELDTNEAAGTAPDRQEAPSDSSPASEPSEDSIDGTDAIDPDAPAGQHEDAITPAPERLVSYARDMMAIAGGEGDAGLKKDRLGKAHARWRDDIAKLTPNEQERAKSILISAQLVAKGEAYHNQAVEFFAEVLGVEPDKLMEDGNG
ncbi:hypothetical protein [Aureimonas glaciei]|uniref:RecT family protein n=1 Tax=Aureimonas glaciei TaxID=1776957 RepID=A0A916YFH7_9HYPH|nr:hypothetical protein [Aureimonas glaciei]GGD43077.1 hypothetical protein GCM10011335_52160 [Aureimonas glaciei]